jgi:hypothetical protein
LDNDSYVSPLPLFVVRLFSGEDLIHTNDDVAHQIVDLLQIIQLGHKVLFDSACLFCIKTKYLGELSWEAAMVVALIMTIPPSLLILMSLLYGASPQVSQCSLQASQTG